MKISRVIQLAGLMERGNVLPEELAIEFLSEFDGMIQSDIMLHAPEEIVRYDSKDQELILRPPHDGLYVSFLVAMIRQCQGEFEGYNNAQEIVEDKLKTFRRWYIHHYRPADTCDRSYIGGTSGGAFGFAYLSAYGLAVKHGYQGTEEEWLKSLKGDAGEAARMRYDAERDMVQWGVGDEWHDLYTMAEVLAPLYAKLEALRFTAADAGKLLMVAGDGSVVPVVVGPGLEIIGGVLRLSGDVVIPGDPGGGEIPIDPDETTAELGVARLGLIILGKE